MNRNQAIRSFLIGGILPVIAFTVIEEKFGTWWGLVAGMIFGVGEIIYEWRSQGKVSAITWIGNGLILVLGAVSLLTTDGVWFKLQPAIIEAAIGLGLVGSVIARRPVLLMMIEKQMAQSGQATPAGNLPLLKQFIGGMTVRIGLFFLANAALATWAALHWSTEAWAFLKGVGFTIALIIYMVVENVYLRYRIAQRTLSNARSEP